MDGWVIKGVFLIGFHMRELIRESAGNPRAFLSDHRAEIVLGCLMQRCGQADTMQIT